MTSTQAYRLLALSPVDPLAEASWRWQRAGYIATVLLRKISLRGALPHPGVSESLLRKHAAWAARMRTHGSRSAQ